MKPISLAMIGALFVQMLCSPCFAQGGVTMASREDERQLWAMRSPQAAQFLGGAALGGVAGAFTFLIGKKIRRGDDEDRWNAASTLMFVGAPLALALATSGAVYSIGKYYDGSEHGSYVAALAGAAGGLALPVLVGSYADLEPSSAIVMMIVAPALSSVLCYQKSKHGFTSLVRVEDGRTTVGVPIPRTRLTPAAEGDVDIGCSVDLLKVTF